MNRHDHALYNILTVEERQLLIDLRDECLAGIRRYLESKEYMFDMLLDVPSIFLPDQQSNLRLLWMDAADQPVICSFRHGPSVDILELSTRDIVTIHSKLTIPPLP